MFKNLYKQTMDNGNMQESRRRRLLDEHKHKRSLLQDKNRDLEAIVSQARKNETKRKQKNRYFRDFYQTDHALQQSEWLRECPENLCDWFLVACPKGQRCMVVACNGRTEMFSKDGRIQMRFRSILPGDGTGRNTITILDCLYVHHQNRFYILDALAFGNQDLLECEAQFRFFWVRSKIEELEASEISERNAKEFICLNQHDFEDEEEVSAVLQKYPYWLDNCPELDGYLFYHKEANYTCGRTPLVGWLFPFMITEVLGYEVSCAYQRPVNYVSYLNYIAMFDAMVSKKNLKKQRRSNDEKMDDIGIDEKHNTVDEDTLLLPASQQKVEVEKHCMSSAFDSDCVDTESRSWTY